MNAKFVTAQTMRMQWSANGSEPLGKDGNRYAYGTEVFVNTYVPGKMVVGHSGGGGGFSVDLIMEPESGTIVVVMSNIHGMNREMSGNYLSAALGQATSPARLSGPVRTVDHLLLKELPYFQQDPARFFREIEVPKYSRNFLGEVTSYLDEIKRADLARGVEEVSRKLHGEPDVGQGTAP